MTPEDQAKTLAAWLESHPGTEPPGDLDAEVVEALYVLRPDLAPPPRVSVDDFFVGLTGGPFAAPSGLGMSGSERVETIDALDDEFAPTEIASTITYVPPPSKRSAEERDEDAAAKARAKLAALPTPEERRARQEAEAAAQAQQRRRVFFGTGGVGGALALAAVALFALRGTLSAPDTSPAAAAPEALSEDMRVFEPSTAERKAEATLSEPEEAPPPPPLAAKEKAEGLVAPETEVREDRGQTAAADGMGTLADDTIAGGIGMGAAPSGGAFAGADAGTGGAAPAPSMASASRAAPTPMEDSVDQEEEPFTEPVSAPVAQNTGLGNTGYPNTGELLEAEADAVADLDSTASADEALAYEMVEESAKRETRTSSRRRTAGLAKKTESAAPSEAPSVEEAAPPSLGDLRQQAMPRDLPSEPAGASETYRKARAASDVYARGGQTRLAADTLRAQVRDPATEGMAHAARASELYRSLGALTDATAVARTGLGLSAANTPWRALLFVRLGDALQDLGDTAGATSAYQNAIALNAAR
jgi:hypothetical protein